MAYNNLPDWYVNRAPVEPMSDAELAASMEKFERHVQYWEQAKRDAYFSEYMTPEGFPEFYYIAGQVFEFGSAGGDLVWYFKQDEPTRKRVFTADLTRFDVGKQLCEAAAAGAFQAK